MADLRSRIGQHQERRAGLHLDVETSRSEISAIDGEIGNLTAAVQQAQGQADEAERNVQAVQARLEQADREIRELAWLIEHDAYDPMTPWRKDRLADLRGDKR